MAVLLFLTYLVAAAHTLTVVEDAFQKGIAFARNPREYWASVETAVGVEKCKATCRLAVDSIENATYPDLSVRVQSDRIYRAACSSSHTKTCVQRSIRVQAGDSPGGCSVVRQKITADHNFAVRL